MDWYEFDGLHESKFSKHSQNFKDTPVCAQFRGDNQTLMVLNSKMQLSIFNARNRKRVTTLQFDRSNPIKSICAGKNTKTNILCAGDSTANAFLYDITAYDKPLNIFKSNDDINDKTGENVECIESTSLFPIQEIGSNMLFGMTCTDSYCRIFDSRSGPGPIASIKVVLGSDRLTKGCSLFDGMKLVFACGWGLLTYDMRHLHSGPKDQLLFDDNVVDFSTFSEKNEPQKISIAAILANNLVKFVSSKDLIAFDTWKSSQNLNRIFCSNGRDFTFLTTTDNEIKMRLNLENTINGKNDNKTKESTNPKLSTKKLRFVKDYDYENLKISKLDTVIDTEKSIQPRAHVKESKIDKNLRKMNHTLALEECLRMSNSDDSVLMDLLEELVRRKVLENVIEAMDENLVPKFLTLLKKLIFNRTYAEICLYCVDLILTKRSNNLEIFSHDLILFEQFLNQRKDFCNEAEKFLKCSNQLFT